VILVVDTENFFTQVHRQKTTVHLEYGGTLDLTKSDWIDQFYRLYQFYKGQPDH
jgi:hypothetical protein